MAVKKRIDNPETGATLEYVPLSEAKGMVVICPGGGYRFVSPREADPVAHAFAGAGWQAFVLTYSVEPAPLGAKPLREAAWAVRAARAAGEAMGLAGTPLALCGFSAGGHLAASLGVHWHDAALFPDSEARRRQRPDALILCYPVITAGPRSHAGSIARLTGGSGDAGYFSLEKHVCPGTPPAFLWHTAEDASVPVHNSFLFAEALVAHGVPVEMHVYPFGVHGLSLATGEVAQPAERRLADPHVAEWFGQCVRWLELVAAKKA